MITGYDVEHLELYQEDVHKILEDCNLHNMSLHTCRQIIDLMATVCDNKSPSGAVQWLRQKIDLVK